MTSRRPRARGHDGEAVRELARTAAREAADRRGREVAVLDLRGLTSATDFFVIASGESDVRPWHVEGLRSSAWVLLDYVDFVVHVFHRDARDFYDLERLWGDAPAERFEAEGAPADRESDRSH